MALKKIKKISKIKAKRTEAKLLPEGSFQKTDFFIVGIGASAGGLEAFKEFVSNLPVNTGMAFVFILHLSAKKKSFLPGILRRMTEIPVVQVTDGLEIKKNQIYVIPPNKTLLLENAIFKLKLRPKGSLHHPIDRFFESLASYHGERGISIVLSGTGTDGAEGSRMLRAAGGICIAQSLETALYDSMPSKAILMNEIDLVLSPKEIALELGNLSQISFKEGMSLSDDSSNEDIGEFKKILMLLKQNLGTDFTQYKPTTIRRRIARRMMMHKLDQIKDYFRLLQNDLEERRLLCEDVLINVTNFFRESDSYEFLKKNILEKIISTKQNGESLRIWAAGCSTGEEAYSIAICVLETLEQSRISLPVQIFATDLSEKCIERARAGRYPPSITEHVSEERLAKYFVKNDGGYRINKAVRDNCIFARHDLSRDPAYSKLDLISCKNLLIYLGQDLQSKIMNNFHYSLNSSGFLCLGSSESIGKGLAIFELVDSKYKVYRKKSIIARPQQFIYRSDFMKPAVTVESIKKEASEPNSFELQVEADRVILARYSPPSVVIDNKMEIIQFRGNTSNYLVHKHGEATLNIVKMAREGLGAELKIAINKSKDKNSSIRVENIKYNGTGIVTVEIIPLIFLAGRRCYLVIFESVSELTDANQYKTKSAKKKTRTDSEEEIINQLKNELNSARENLQAVVQDFEMANQELQSANEEVLSANEELQSTNEELETSKEELQSTNEELSTVNDELQETNVELFQLNNDLNNVLNIVQIPIVIVGNDLSIRRYTISASKIFNFIPSDIGRPLSHITSKVINMPDLNRMIKNVLDNAVIEEKNVHNANGSWYHLRIRPYKTQENKIEGAVVTLQEIEMNKLVEFTKTITDNVKLPLLILDKEIKIIHCNKYFFSEFNLKSESLQGKSLHSLPKPLNASKIIALISDLLKSKKTRSEKILTLEFSRNNKRQLIVSATKVSKDKFIPPKILVAFEKLEGIK